MPGFYSFVMNFCMDAISRSLKDHLPTNLSFTANSPDEAMADNPGQPGSGNTGASGDSMLASANNPETTSAAVNFSDPELEQIIMKYNMKFENPQELIEVCLVALAATAYMMEKNREMHNAFDTFMFNNVDKILKDKSQDVLVR